MSADIFWFVLAGILGVLELATGTFYLLVFGMAAAAAGLAALGGAVFTLQIVVAALVAAAGVVWLRSRRRGTPAAQDLDAGNPVEIVEWSDPRRARVRYRGAEWDAELAAGEPDQPLACVVRAVSGNRLVIGKR